MPVVCLNSLGKKFTVWLGLDMEICLTPAMALKMEAGSGLAEAENKQYETFYEGSFLTNECCWDMEALYSFSVVAIEMKTFFCEQIGQMLNFVCQKISRWQALS